MAFDISFVYKAIDRFSPTTNAIKRSVDSVSKKFTKLQRTVKETGASLRKVGSSLALKVTAPILGFAGLAIKTSADIETMKVAFESMTGSAEKASEVVKGLIDFTAKTPFQLAGVGKAAKQLLSFGVSTEELQGKLKFLGDIAAGANVPLSDMAAIFGKSKAKGKAMTEELLQLSDRGIPIIDTLAKGMGVSKDKIFDLASKGKISFSILEKALIKLTQKGGVFFNQMAKQSKTTTGLFSTLKDNVVLAMAAVGDQIIETFDLKQVLKDSIAFIQRMTAGFKQFVKNNPRLAKFVLILIGALAVLGPLAIAIGGLVAILGILLNPITLIIVGVVALVGAIAAIIIKFKVVRDILSLFGRVLSAVGRIVFAFGKALFNGITLPIRTLAKFISSILNLFFDFDGMVKSTTGSVGSFLETFDIQPIIEDMQRLTKWIEDVAVAIEEAFSFDNLTSSIDKGISSLTGGIGEFFGVGGPEASVAAQSISTSAKLDANINIAAPPGVVTGATSKVSGASARNVGMNMVEDGA